MKTIRIGNDINVTWKVFSRNGLKYSLEEKEIHLWLISGPYKTEITSFVVSFINEVSFNIDESALTRYGTYKLVLQIKDPASIADDSAYDLTEVFQIVSQTYSGEVLDGSVDLVFESVLNNVYVSTLRGESAYEVAVRNGYTGTEEEWLHDPVNGIMGNGVTSFELIGDFDPAPSANNKYRITPNVGDPFDFIVKNGVGLTSVEADESTADSGTSTYTMHFSDGTDQVVIVKNGTGVASIEQITVSTEDGGTNVIRVTMSDGRYADFQIKNGTKGSAGSSSEYPFEIYDGLDSADNEKALSAKQGGVLDTKISENKQAVLDNNTAFKLTKLTPASIIESYYFAGSGEFVSSANLDVYKYAVTEGSMYAFSGRFPATFDVFFLGWFDQDGVFISKEPYRGSAYTPTAIDRQVVEAPVGAAFAYLNVRKTQAALSAVYSADALVRAQDVFESEQAVTKNFEETKSTLGDTRSAGVELPLSHVSGHYISGNTGEIISAGSSIYVEAGVSGLSFVRFLGVNTESIVGTGYVFYDENDDPIVGAYNAYDFGGALHQKEYFVQVPAGAVTLRYTTKVAAYNIDADTYAYGIRGDLIAREIDELKEKIGDGGYSALPLHVEKVSGHFINGTDGSISEGGAYFRADVSGFQRVKFRGVVLRIAGQVSGFAFYDLNNVVVSSSVWDIDTSLSAVKTKDYIVDVPEGASTIAITTLMGAYNIQGILNLRRVIGQPISENLSAVDSAIRQRENVLLTRDSKLDNQMVLIGGEVRSSDNYDGWVYNNIDPHKTYLVSGALPIYTSPALVCYYHDETFVGYEVHDYYNPVKVTDRALTIPKECNTILLNVRKTAAAAAALKEVQYGDYYDFDKILEKEITKEPISVKYNAEDGSFTLRSRFDELNDILVTVDYSSAYNFQQNFLRPSYAYIGNKNLTDDELIQLGGHNISDTIGPITMDFCGPIFANHGYCTPKVTIQNNPMTADDVGSVWHDDIAETRWETESGYREYTIGKVDGNVVYLLPIIRNVGGHTRRDWVYYNSPEPHSLTPMHGTILSGTIPIASEARFDYQVCKCDNIKLYVDGCLVEQSGKYAGKEVLLAYDQICYDPTDVSVWWPSPQYGAIQVIFNRSFVFSADKGFFSMTNNQKMDVKTPFELGLDYTGCPTGRYIGMAPTAPFKTGDYDSYVYIPKLVKQYAGTPGSTTDTPIDFRGEFVANSNLHPLVGIKRDSDSLKDVNDLPDRLYSYLMNSNDEILRGFAGGHSLVRGMSVPEVRNQMVPLGSSLGWWNPPVSNKFYSFLMRKGDDGNTVTDGFAGMNEGYHCWYIPRDGVHAFYYKSGNQYVICVHTTGTKKKGEVVLPTWMNGLSVSSLVEKTDNISLVDDVVVNGKLHVNATIADGAGGAYNYIVFTLK